MNNPAATQTAIMRANMFMVEPLLFVGDFFGEPQEMVFLPYTSCHSFYERSAVRPCRRRHRARDFRMSCFTRVAMARQARRDILFCFVGVWTRSVAVVAGAACA